MGEFGGSLSNAITSQRRYGSTNSQTFSLAVIDTKVITHKLSPSDTLQGLAIKYSVSVEKLKRLNKLWSNESIHIKETLLIPCSSGHITASKPSPISSSGYEVLDEKVNKRFCQKKTDDSDELHSSWKENDADASNKIDSKERSEAFKQLDNMLAKVDSQIESHKQPGADSIGSDSYKCFTEMLSKIDCQIKLHKNKSQTSATAVPEVGYDSYQNLGGGHRSPIKQHPFLEQGI